MLKKVGVTYVSERLLPMYPVYTNKVFGEGRARAIYAPPSIASGVCIPVGCGRRPGHVLCTPSRTLHSRREQGEGLLTITLRNP